MKHIVIDARESGTSTGRYVDKLIEYLHKLQPKHQITLLAKPHRVDYLKSVAPSFTVKVCLFKEFTFGEQIGLLQQINELKPDLVFFPMVQQPIRYKGKVVTMMQDLTTARWRNPAKNRAVFTVKQTVYKRVNRQVAKKSAQLLTPSEFVRQDVAKFCHVSPHKITVTYEAADPIAAPAEPLPHLKGQRFIMYVGRPLPHKNLDRLLQAFTLLQQDDPKLHLVLAGKKDSLFDQLAQRVHKQGLRNVVFTDFVSDAQLRWLYEHTAAYVFPSLSEGFGLPGLEAMVHGAPVVSSNATCLPEVYKDGALYFDPLDPRDMAAKIQKVITDKAYAKKLAARGKKVAKGYSWQRTAQQTLTVFDKVLK